MIFGLYHNTMTYTKNSPSFILYQSGHKLHFSPKSGLLEYTNNIGYSELLSDSIFNHASFKILTQNDSSLSIDYTDHGLTFKLLFKKDLEIEVKFKSSRPQTLYWPKVSISKANHFFIWPRNGGYYIPFSDSLFAKKFDGANVSATYLSLPFWAVEKVSTTNMYEMVSPFHNTISFEDQDSTMNLTVMHHYTPNAVLEEPYIIKIIHLSNHSPITPALHFREKLEKNNDIVSFNQKIESVPLTKRMIGAPWAKLISGQFISKYDVLEGKVIPLAKAIIKNVHSKKGFVAAQWDKLEPDQRELMKQVSHSEGLSNYQQKAFIRILGSLLKEDGVNEEFTKDRRKNAELLYADYPEYLLPPCLFLRFRTPNPGLTGHSVST